MTRRPLALSLLTLTVLAACGKTDSPESAADSVIAAAPPAPKNPHVVGFDLGRAADASGRVFGGTVDRFGGADTIVVAIRTQYATAGAIVSARLRLGGRTIDSTGLPIPAADSTGFANAAIRFAPKGAARTAGTYQVETFLDTLSQGIKEITVHQ